MESAVYNIVGIKCFLSQEQIDDIVNYVSGSLSQDLDCLSDIDIMMYDNSIRVCVDFEKGLFGDLVITSAEILDADWDVLSADSFAFSQRLEDVISDYNRQYKEAYNQAIEIHRDQLEYLSYTHC